VSQFVEKSAKRELRTSTRSATRRWLRGRDSKPNFPVQSRASYR
jgi:hypothetical protein